VAVVLEGVELFQAVEGLEQRHLGLGLAGLGGAAKVFDQHPGIDLLLDVERRGIALQHLGLFVLALPNELGVEAVVTLPAHRHGLLDLGGDEVLGVGGGDVGALVGVDGGLDRLRARRCLAGWQQVLLRWVRRRAANR